MTKLTRRSALMTGGALAALAACGQAETPAAPATDGNADFEAIGKAWLDELARSSPTYATQLGDHRFDGELPDVSEAGRAGRMAQVKTTQTKLAAIDRATLSRENQVDAAMLAESLEAETFRTEKLQDWAWDPITYAGSAGGALYNLIARDFAPLPERLLSAAARMEKFAGMLAETRKQIVPERVPPIHAQTYSSQNAGAVSIIDDLILAQAKDLGPADKARLTAAADAAKAAIAEHQKWIDETLVPAAKGDFRYGPELYDLQLRYAINSPTPRADLLAKARADADAIRDEMFEICARLVNAKPNADKLATIKAGMAVAAKDRPLRQNLFSDAAKTTEEATAFIRAKDFISLPDAPVKIIEMPKFQQGFSVAYCDSPGPLDRQLETFYAISPIPADWDETRVKSFLSEYNSHMLYELSIHEAMPGHYLQIWHSNKNPSVTRAVLGSGTFIEGWACYAEDLMIEQGFGADNPLRRLTNLKMRLRSVTNAILDQGIHIENWDEATAMTFMTGEAFQEEREAAGKWTRARLSSGQLSTYFVGWGEHHALRKHAEATWGADFNLKKYHDTALSHGSPPARFVRQLMFGEPIA
jgi:uncharacterized protein (DUF885 family)